MKGFHSLLNCLFMEPTIRYDHSGTGFQVLLIFVSHRCHFAFNPTILAIRSIINFFVENSTEMDEVRCLTMKLVDTEPGIKSWVAVCKMSCLLLVLSVAVSWCFCLYCTLPYQMLSCRQGWYFCYRVQWCVLKVGAVYVCAEHDWADCSKLTSWNI